MKTLFTLVTSLCLVSTAFSQTNLEKAEAYYNMGLAAEKAGDPSKATRAYNAALQLNPQHANARYRAGEVKIRGNALRVSAQEKKIGSVIIPVYQIEDATVSEATQLLAVGIERASEGKVAPNFVINDPERQLKDARVTMQLKNIPASAIIQYITSQSGSKARYSQHAVSISPR